MQNTIIIDKKTGSVRQVYSEKTVSAERASVFLMQLAPESVANFDRNGDDLVIVLKNGQKIVISNFFVKYVGGKPADDEDGENAGTEGDADPRDRESERNDLILEDDEGVAWWGQYPED